MRILLFFQSLESTKAVKTVDAPRDVNKIPPAATIDFEMLVNDRPHHGFENVNIFLLLHQRALASMNALKSSNENF